MSDARGGPTRGTAGTIERTRRTAPGIAGDELIEAVAFHARDRDIDPEEIWTPIQKGECATTATVELANSSVILQRSPVGVVARVEPSIGRREYALLADETVAALLEVAQGGEDR